MYWMARWTLGKLTERIAGDAEFEIDGAAGVRFPPRCRRPGPRPLAIIDPRNPLRLVFMGYFSGGKGFAVLIYPY